MKSETIFVQKYPEHGYEVRTEIVDHQDGSEPMEMLRAYTLSGVYIGKPRDAIFLCKEKGIVPEEGSIGFCEAEQKWYGWSNRAIFGFGIGSSVKKGDSGYTPSNVRELAKDLEKNGEHGEIIDEGTVQVATKVYTIEGENEDGTIKLADEHETEYYTVNTGRGRWTARTLDDARQMAIDFANDVA